MFGDILKHVIGLLLLGKINFECLSAKTSSVNERHLLIFSFSDAGLKVVLKRSGIASG
jgi:hypothetical protein